MQWFVTSHVAKKDLYINNRIRYITMLTDNCIASNLKLLTAKFDSRCVSRILTSFCGVHVLERLAAANRDAEPLRGSASRFARGRYFQYMNTLNSVNILYISLITPDSPQVPRFENLHHRTRILHHCLTVNIFDQVSVSKTPLHYDPMVSFLEVNKQSKLQFYSQFVLRLAEFLIYPQTIYLLHLFHILHKCYYELIFLRHRIL